MATRIQVRRDNAADWNSVNPTLAEGEIGYETDTGKFKIGNGSSLWSSLDYFLDSSDLSGYLTASSASTIYLTQDSASATYLTQASASTTYATKTGGTFTGNITAPEVHATTKLVAETVGADEGGEILLGKPATNSTIAGTGVTIDVFQNRLRIFEQGGDARGGYIDVSTLGNGIATNLVPGMVLVKKQTIGSAVTSVTVTNAFSETYDNYKITVGGASTSSANVDIRLSFNGTSSFYQGNLITYNYSGAPGGTVTSTPDKNQASFRSICASIAVPSTGMDLDVEIKKPFLTTFTSVSSHYADGDKSGIYVGHYNDNLSVTDFTLTPSSGTLTGGIIRVYGYANS